MPENSLLMLLLVGAIVGWLAGVIVRGYGFGLVGNIVVGVIGSLVGDWLFRRFHVVQSHSMLGEIVGATLGAAVMLFLLRFIRRLA